MLRMSEFARDNISDIGNVHTWSIAESVSAALDAITGIAGGEVNIHVLMALAAFASVFMGNALEGRLLLAMFNLAHIAEEFFTSRSMVDVKELKENYPVSVLVLNLDDDNLPNVSDLSHRSVPVYDVEVGSYILVGTGEAVPVDCEVFQGSATITIEHLTGEIKPLEAKVGNRIPASWWCKEFGRFTCLALPFDNSLTWSLSMFYFELPSTCLILGIAYVVCRGSIYRALGLMVAASPCALAVAPLAYATAVSSCARRGILLKGGQVLDALASCHTVAFDKTGTLTTGGLMFKAIEPIYGHLVGNKKTNFTFCCIPCCDVEALALAAAMEKGTTHPIGRAVVDHSIGKDLPSVSVESFELFSWQWSYCYPQQCRGTRGKMLEASLGSVEFIPSLCKSEDESRKIRAAVNASSYGSDFMHLRYQDTNELLLYIFLKVTLIHLEDKPRPGIFDVISELKDQAKLRVMMLTDQAKLRVMMLTGDHKSSAWRVAKDVGINDVYCSLKPEDKLNHVKRISRDMKRNSAKRGSYISPTFMARGGLIMVGEGINDTPALAAATVGIVLAHRSSTTATAVADVLLLQDNISGVPFSIAKARQTTSWYSINLFLIPVVL
ncbi:hypothetical protein CRYUN_Cryun22dG0093500 [Craigia yunnanensis]